MGGSLSIHHDIPKIWKFVKSNGGVDQVGKY